MVDQTHYAIVQYDGGGFAGWQRQSEERTVQGVLEDGLERITDKHRVTHAAGRTDAGVHALGQVVSFQVPGRWTSPELHRALNAVTPPDLWIAAVGEAPPGFNARKHAVARRYRYVLGCEEGAASPFRRPFEWALRKAVDFELLRAAATRFLGEHDFRSFSSVGQEKPHYRCRIAASDWQQRPSGQGYIFHIEANRFLHRMVRFLVGMMVDVGLGKRPMDDIAALLGAADNAEASPPAPPEGLYMVGALYQEPELHRINDFVSQQ
jgi:tRNA pseudouridine38-40 synthase